MHINPHFCKYACVGQLAVFLTAVFWQTTNSLAPFALPPKFLMF